MKRLFFLSAVLLSAAIISCDDSTAPPNGPAAVTLEEIDDVLPNPFKGFVPWVGNENPVYDTRLQYKTYEWNDLEPQKSVYNWAAMESGWGSIQTTGRRVGIRVSAATPGDADEVNIPGWLVDMGVPLRGYSIDGYDGLAPDWDDPLFLQAHRDFILALGAKYNSDERIAWVDIGSYGFWGEWHVYLNDSLAATEQSKQSMLDDYFDAFPDKPLVIAFDDDFATEYVTDRGGGIRNDCLGTSDSNDWYLSSLNRIDPGLNDLAWRTGIITGEFCGSDAGAVAGTSERYELNLEFIKQTHWSFIGPAGGVINPISDAHKENLDELHKLLGYRFVLRDIDIDAQAESGSTVELVLSVENKGIAPFYFEWPLVLYLVRDDVVQAEAPLNVDIRQWLPGTHNLSTEFQLAAGLEAGDYDLKLAIEDPQSGEPGIDFANTQRDAEGRYLVSRLEVQ